MHYIKHICHCIPTSAICLVPAKNLLTSYFCYGFCAESSFTFCLIAKNFVKINDFSYVTLIFTSWNCGWSFFVLSVNCCRRGQKQPFRGVLKICSKFTGEHPCRNHSSAWKFSCKFAAYFQNTSGRLLLYVYD